MSAAGAPLEIRSLDHFTAAFKQAAGRVLPEALRRPPDYAVPLCIATCINGAAQFKPILPAPATPQEWLAMSLRLTEDVRKEQPDYIGVLSSIIIQTDPVTHAEALVSRAEAALGPNVPYHSYAVAYCRERADIASDDYEYDAHHFHAYVIRHHKKGPRLGPWKEGLAPVGTGHTAGEELHKYVEAIGMTYAKLWADERDLLSA